MKGRTVTNGAELAAGKANARSGKAHYDKANLERQEKMAETNRRRLVLAHTERRKPTPSWFNSLQFLQSERANIVFDLVSPAVSAISVSSK
jgi:hypothetical protein